MENVLRVTNLKGRNFNVKLVKKGDRHGRNDCLVHDKTDPLVQFYDETYTKGFTELGQFVASYYASTLLDRGRYELSLDTSIPEWTVSASNMVDIQNWLKENQV